MFARPVRRTPSWPVAMALASVLALLAACTDAPDGSRPAPALVGSVSSWEVLLDVLRDVGVCDTYECHLTSEVSSAGTSSAVIRSDVWAGGVGAVGAEGPNANDGVAACATVLAAGYDFVQAWGDPDDDGWHLMAESGHTPNGCNAVAAGSRP